MGAQINHLPPDFFLEGGGLGGGGGWEWGGEVKKLPVQSSPPYYCNQADNPFI